MNHLVNHPAVAASVLLLPDSTASPLLLFNATQAARQQLSQRGRTGKNGGPQPPGTQRKTLFHAQCSAGYRDFRVGDRKRFTHAPVVNRKAYAICALPV